MSVFRGRRQSVTDNGFVGRAAAMDLYPEREPLTIVPYLDAKRRNVPTIAASMSTNPLTFGPMWKLATRIGALPIKIYSFGPGGVKTEESTHDAYTLLRKPNPVFTRSLLIAGTVMNLLVEGKGAWLKVREEADGPPVEVWPIIPSTLRVHLDARGLIERFGVASNWKAERPLRLEDVCYFRLLPKYDDWSQGQAPFEPLRTIGGMGSAAIDAADDMFMTGMLGRVWAEISQELSPRAFNRLKRQLQQARAGGRFGIPLLEGGAKLHDHAAPDDEVLIRGIEIATKVINETLGLDDPAAFYQNAVQPIADAIEQELERTLMPEFDKPGFPEFAFRDLLRGDPLQRAQLHQTRILSGQETPDEARRDENRPPLPDGAGEKAFIPLNLVPIDDTADDGVPRETDTGGGLGGDEGKGTLAAASAQPGAPGALATSVTIGMAEAALREGDGRAENLRARKKNWGTLRDRIVGRYAQVMSRRIRGVVNKEAKAIKAALNDGRQARAEGVVLPPIADLKQIIADSDPEIAEILDKFMRQTGDASGPGAAELLGHELSETALEHLADVYESRAAAVAERFAGVRGDRIISLVETAAEKGTPIRELASQIGEAYSNLSTTYTDGIARTEVAFAHEQAALVTWADAGVRQVEIVFGGGSCTTGVCEDNADGSPYRLGETMGNVGVSFEGADAPPFHPGCTCYAVPFIEDES